MAKYRVRTDQGTYEMTLDRDLTAEEQQPANLLKLLVQNKQIFPRKALSVEQQVDVPSAVDTETSSGPQEFMQDIGHLGQEGLRGLAGFLDLPSNLQIPFPEGYGPPRQPPPFRTLLDMYQRATGPSEIPPATAVGRYGGAVSRSIGSALPLLPIGGPLASQLQMLTAAGLGEEAFQDLFGKGPIQAMVGSVATGLTPAALSSIPRLTPPLLKAALESRVGELFKHLVSPNFSENLEKARELSSRINALQPPGGARGIGPTEFRPTTGQASGEPNIIGIEQAVRRGTGGGATAEEIGRARTALSEQQVGSEAALRQALGTTVPWAEGLPEAQTAIQSTQALAAGARATELGTAESRLTAARQQMQGYIQELQARQAGKVAIRETEVKQAGKHLDTYLDQMRQSLEQRVADAENRVRVAFESAGGTQDPIAARTALHKAIETEKGHFDYLESEAYAAVDPFGRLRGSTAPMTSASKAMLQESERSIEPARNFPLDIIERVLDPVRLAGLDTFNKLHRARSLLLAEARAEASKGGAANEYLIRRLNSLAQDANLNMREIAAQNPAALAQFDKAQALHREGVMRFESGVTGEVLQPTSQGRWRVAVSDAFDKYWNASRGVPEAVEDLTRTVGTRADAMDAVYRLATKDLQDAATNPTTDKIVTSKLMKWLKDHNEQLQQFPELQRRFSTVASAQRTVDDASALMKQGEKLFPKVKKTSLEPAEERLKTAERLERKGEAVYPKLEKAGTAASEEELTKITKRQTREQAAFQASPAGRLLRADPETAMKQALQGENPRQAMRDLVREIGPSQEARRGLQQAFRQYEQAFLEAPGGIAKVPASTMTEGMGGQPVLSATRLNNFRRVHRGAMEELYSPAQLKNLDTMQEGFNLLERRNLSLSQIPESSTSANVYSAAMLDALLGRERSYEGLLTPKVWRLPGIATRRIAAVVKNISRDRLRPVILEALQNPDVAETLIQSVSKPVPDTLRRLRSLMATTTRAISQETATE